MYQIVLLMLQMSIWSDRPRRERKRSEGVVAAVIGRLEIGYAETGGQVGRRDTTALCLLVAVRGKMRGHGKDGRPLQHLALRRRLQVSRIRGRVTWVNVKDKRESMNICA